jgi:hypothetical protein
MSTPTVKLIDITSDLSAHPTSADHDSQSTDSGAKPAVSAPKLAAASGQSPGWYRSDIQSANRLVDRNGFSRSATGAWLGTETTVFEQVPVPS